MSKTVSAPALTVVKKNKKIFFEPWSCNINMHKNDFFNYFQVGRSLSESGKCWRKYGNLLFKIDRTGSFGCKNLFNFTCFTTNFHNHGHINSFALVITDLKARHRTLFTAKIGWPPPFPNTESRSPIWGWIHGWW